MASRVAVWHYAKRKPKKKGEDWTLEVQLQDLNSLLFLFSRCNSHCRSFICVSDKPSVDLSLAATELRLHCPWFSGVCDELCTGKQARIQLDLPHLKGT